MNRRVCLLSLVVALSGSGCGPLIQGMAPTYRTTQANSNIHAWSTSQWAFTNADLNNAQWVSTLDKVEKGASPLLEAMRAKGHALTIEVVPHASGMQGEIETYEVAVKVQAKGSEQESTRCRARQAPIPACTSKQRAQPLRSWESRPMSCVKGTSRCTRWST